MSKHLPQNNNTSVCHVEDIYAIHAMQITQQCTLHKPHTSHSRHIHCTTYTAQATTPHTRRQQATHNTTHATHGILHVIHVIETCDGHILWKGFKTNDTYSSYICACIRNITHHKK